MWALKEPVKQVSEQIGSNSFKGKQSCVSSLLQLVRSLCAKHLLYGSIYIHPVTSDFHLNLFLASTDVTAFRLHRVDLDPS